MPTFPTLTTLGAAVVGRWNALNVTTSGGNVTAMSDLSGNSNNMSNTGTVPYSASGFNGNPALSFLAANSALMSAAGVPLSGTSFFLYAVGQMLTNTAANGGLLVCGAPTQTDFFGTNSAAVFTRQGSGNAIDSRGGAFSGPADNAISLATDYRLGIIYDQATAAATFLINNSAGTASGASSSGLGPTLTAVIGGRWSSGSVDTSAPWEGLVTEIVLGTTTSGTPLNSTDQNAIDAYFVAQWFTAPSNPLMDTSGINIMRVQPPGWKW